MDFGKLFQSVEDAVYEIMVWILLLPLRIVGIVVEGVLGLLSGIVMLPARLVSGPRAW